MKSTLLRKSIIYALLGTVIVASNSTTIKADTLEIKNHGEVFESNDDSIKIWKKKKIGEYPMNSDNEEWSKLSYCDIIKINDMPDEYAKTLSTEELIEYAVNYPLLTDVLAYDSIELGLEHLKKSSSVFGELYSRKDCIEALLKKYCNMSCDYKSLEESKKDMTETGYIAEMFIEEYIGNVYDALSCNEKKTFIDEFGKKFEEKTKSVKKYQTATIFYDAMLEKTNIIPEDAIPENMQKDFLIDYSSNELSFIEKMKVTNPFNGAWSSYGYETINNSKVECYKLIKGEYTAAEKKKLDEQFENNHPTFVKKKKSSKKYNCHSYAWYSMSANDLWVVNPENIAKDSNFYVKWRIPMREYQYGDRVLFYSGNTLVHSGIYTSAKKCKAKCGRYGVYKMKYDEMKALYNATSSQAYIPK